jgi:uncharacterized protein YceH (UPF0502 family)
MSEEGLAADGPPAPKWKPIGRVERRVLGVLVEKAKTTPDAYPLTLKGIVTGCNQKSNREPQMDLDSDQVETSLEKLRHLSAVIEVTGGGRVAKYRHLVYEWMGVDKTEAAVMAELLLRGSQTTGELRGRAARMSTISDVAALQPILQALIKRGLALSLTPPGRGQIVTHALHLPEEMDKVRKGAKQMDAERPGHASRQPAALEQEDKESEQEVQTAVTTSTARSSPPTGGDVAQLRTELDQLKAEVARLKSDVKDLWSNIG